MVGGVEGGASIRGCEPATPAERIRRLWRQMCSEGRRRRPGVEARIPQWRHSGGRKEEEEEEELVMELGRRGGGFVSPSSCSTVRILSRHKGPSGGPRRHIPERLKGHSHPPLTSAASGKDTR